MIPSSTRLFSHWSISLRTPLSEGIKSQEDDPVQHGIQSRLLLCREGLFLLPYNELAVAQGPKIYQKKAL